MGEEFICYQHQQAQDILEKLLKLWSFTEACKTSEDIKEAIEWITKANDSAVKMEGKLKLYKQKADNKPDWKDAPEWANWLAKDKNGCWFWYEDNPSINDINNVWSSDKFILCADNFCEDWKDSLEERRV